MLKFKPKMSHQTIILGLIVLFKLSQADFYAPPATSYGVPIHAVEGPKQQIQNNPIVSSFSFDIPEEIVHVYDAPAPPKPISQIYGVPQDEIISQVYGAPVIVTPKPFHVVDVPKQRPIVSSFSYEIPKEVVTFHDVPAPPKPISQIYGVPEVPKPIPTVYGIPEIVKPKPVKPIVSSFSYQIPYEVAPAPPKPVSQVYGVPEIVKPKPEIAFDLPVVEAPKPPKISYTYGIPEVVESKPNKVFYDVPIIVEPKPTISHVYGVPVAYDFPVVEPKPVYGVPGNEVFGIRRH
ncbi:uncharacterized protein [Onthophagus taurus]|uniref:uncharacterized protein n=1 Tax=Onthophagus taurus TaxID=166361 RepID=UPI0039BE6D7B